MNYTQSNVSVWHHNLHMKKIGQNDELQWSQTFEPSECSQRSVQKHDALLAALLYDITLITCLLEKLTLGLPQTPDTMNTILLWTETRTLASHGIKWMNCFAYWQISLSLLATEFKGAPLLLHKFYGRKKILKLILLCWVDYSVPECERMNWFACWVTSFGIVATSSKGAAGLMVK